MSSISEVGSNHVESDTSFQYENDESLLVRAEKPESSGGKSLEMRRIPSNLSNFEEARNLLRQIIEERKFDPLFDQKLLRRAMAVLNAKTADPKRVRDLLEELKLQASLEAESPYLEVRSVVSISDDPTLPVNTFRAWFIGLAFTIVGTGINTFFTARFPYLSVGTLVAQVLSYPFGKLLERALPARKFRVFGREVSLNPGPFNQKEHMLITIMSNVTFGGGGIGVYSSDILVVQRLPQYFNQNALASKAGYQILITLSTQLLGFSLAGVSRRFLVYPPAMIWPSTLATIVLNRSFHDDKNYVANGWKITRLRLFFILLVSYGIYYVFPLAIFGALQIFNWITWISPRNARLALITGSFNGLGLTPWSTFDVNIMTMVVNPWITPLYATYNIAAGMLLLAAPFISIVYFNNIFDTAYLPMISTQIFDNTGAPYNISKVLGPDYTLNPVAYSQYSQPYQTAGNASNFFWFFAGYVALAVHTYLYYSKTIFYGFRTLFDEEAARDAHLDVHNRLMSRYKEVPQLWYIGILATSLLFGIVANEHYGTQFPIWALLFGFGITCILFIPVGCISATANTEITLNVLGELIASYVLGGKPLANMIFKTISVVTSAQAIGYVSDMKLAHYTKIPPRSLFAAQVIASILACFVGIGVVDWQIKNIDGLCTPSQKEGFTCVGTYQLFFNSAVQWGAIGANRLYSAGQPYNSLLFGFLFGAIFPIIPYFLAKKYPLSIWKYINSPVMISGAMTFAPLNFSYIIQGLYLAFFFQHWVRKRYVAFWCKYNYLIGTAFSTAIAIGGIFWYFAIQYRNYQPDWWGNTVSYNGCDFNGCPLKAMPDVGYFGSKPGAIQ